jgi:hypothetical protein
MHRWRKAARPRLAPAALQIPPGLLAGTRLHAVAAALFAPNSLPNGENPSAP